MRREGETRPATGEFVSASAVYCGTVRHRRYAVTPREFKHELALAYLDLGELPGLLGGRLVRRPPGLARFRRRDYHRPDAGSLSDAVRATVASRIGIRPEGPVRLLTQLRTLGVCFNPVSFYYCFEPGGQHLQAVLAEVTNSPWNERHSYVLSGPESASGVLGAEFDKRLHVSPFMGMGYRYRARLTVPGDTLSVHIENWAAGELHFDATLALRRRELSTASVLEQLKRHLPGSLRVLALIYGHGVGLRLAGVPAHPHPASGRS